MNSYGRVAKLALATLALTASVAFLVSGCSEVVFPAVHDMPAARTDATLTPDQVKQATDDLISERNHLSTEAQGNVQPIAVTNAPATTGSLPKKKSVSSVQPAVAQPASGASAYAKP